MKKLLILFTIFTIGICRAGDDYTEIVEVLKYVESNNTSAAVGDGGDSWGVLQIQWAAVQDVNRYYGTQYTHQQMFKPECAEEVAILYMKMGADRYRKRYGEEPSVEVLVRNHNGGIYKGYRNPRTWKYYLKYLFWKRKLQWKEQLQSYSTLRSSLPLVLAPQETN